MGLDMYLTRKTYIGAEYSHNGITGSIELFQHGERIPIDLKKVTYIIESVGYWRKANQIHAWFVGNIQDGVDDCNQYYVPQEAMRDLLKLCKRVQKEPHLGPELLPTRPGFFFGDTDYDEFYSEEITATISILEAILAEEVMNILCESKVSQEYYYQSSW